MDNFTLFDDRNNALFLFYNINGPICILLNLLAIYLISRNERISLAPPPLPVTCLRVIFFQLSKVGSSLWPELLRKVAIPFVLIFIPSLIISTRFLNGHLGLQCVNDILAMMLSANGAVATISLIFFNASYREFLFEKLKGFGTLKNRMH
uniref:G_PROTEIN_RECEP_F1_2 domain-containing protein n=1 Tax=Heterorhabditis bacteriophora TaxID=37862 RepID=A0A1I7WSW4_HETBA